MSATVDRFYRWLLWKLQRMNGRLACVNAILLSLWLTTKLAVNNEFLFPPIWSLCDSFSPSSQKMVQAVLFEDIFDVRVLNENGKKFERGSMLSYFSLFMIVKEDSFSLWICIRLLKLIDWLELPTILTKNAVNRVHSKGTTYDVDLVLGE